MTMVQDPTGAVVALWEPRHHVGAGLVGETGSMCWNELATTDPARAATFYTGLLGWTTERHPMTSTGYTMFADQGAPRGGMMTLVPSWGSVPQWLVYFAVSDIGRQAALAQSLGGSVRVPPTDAPGVGRFSLLADPQGAAFAAIELLPA
jgi:predicted enzyme related to lactoylglutathione lyase